MQTKNSVSGQATKPQFKVGDLVKNQGHIALIYGEVDVAGIPHLKLMITSIFGCAAAGQTYAAEAKHCELYGAALPSEIANFMQGKDADSMRAAGQ
tara:strand:- start:305 stop:592 length:288 start_codon:yes stop_codon:yes gene_type:complete